MVATTLFNMRLITIVCSLIYFLSSLGYVCTHTHHTHHTHTHTHTHHTHTHNHTRTHTPHTHTHTHTHITQPIITSCLVCSPSCDHRLFGGSLAYSCYQNAFLTAFFTFGIRLYQRKKQQEVPTTWQTSV